MRFSGINDNDLRKFLQWLRYAHIASADNAAVLHAGNSNAGLRKLLARLHSSVPNRRIKSESSRTMTRGCSTTPSLSAAVKSEAPYSLVSIHNHGTNVPPSGADFGSAGEKKYAFGIVACHDGTLYKYSTSHARPFAVSVIDKKVDIYMKPPYNMGVVEAFKCAIQEAQNAYGVEWSELK